ncbi:hypothetical protein Tco_1103855 [Tanacetum coccineum]
MPRTMGTHDDEAGSSRSKRSRQYETVEEVLCHDELQSKKIIKFRLGGRAHNLTLLEFARRLGLYHADELKEDGFDVYFQGGLRSDDNFNAQEYWSYGVFTAYLDTVIIQGTTASEFIAPALQLFNELHPWGDNLLCFTNWTSGVMELRKDVTYTSVYTDSEPGRAFWGADYEEISEGGIPRILPVPQDEDEREPMFIQAHDPDYVPEPIYPEYIPLEDDHEFPAEEQPLPPIDSPTTDSPGYVTESDPEEDPEEYEDDETEDGPVDYPMDGGDDEDDGYDGDNDDDDSSGDDARDEDEDEEEHLAPADSTVVPADGPVWICQKSLENSQKRTREWMSDQEAKEIEAKAREIMPQPSTKSTAASTVNLQSQHHSL